MGKAIIFETPKDTNQRARRSHCGGVYSGETWPKKHYDWR
jgi:hypothetical protein